MVHLILSWVLALNTLAASEPLWSASVLCDRFTRGSLSSAEQKELIQRLRTRIAIAVETSQSNPEAFELTGQIDLALRVFAPELVPLLEKLTFLPGKNLLTQQLAALKALLASIHQYQATFQLEHRPPTIGELGLIQGKIQKVLEQEISALMPEMAALYQTRATLKEIVEQELPVIAPLVDGLRVSVAALSPEADAISLSEIRAITAIELEIKTLLEDGIVPKLRHLGETAPTSILEAFTPSAQDELILAFEAGRKFLFTYRGTHHPYAGATEYADETIQWFDAYALALKNAETHLSALIRATEDRAFNEAVLRLPR
jgi:hypothetical protein